MNYSKLISIFLFLGMTLACNEESINRQDHVEVATIWTNAFYAFDLEMFKKVNTKRSLKSYEKMLNLFNVGASQVDGFEKPPIIKAVKDTILDDKIAWIVFEHDNNPEKTSSVRLVKIAGNWIHDEYDVKNEKSPIE